MFDVAGQPFRKMYGLGPDQSAGGLLRSGSSWVSGLSRKLARHTATGFGVDIEDAELSGRIMGAAAVGVAASNVPTLGQALVRGTGVILEGENGAGRILRALHADEHGVSSGAGWKGARGAGGETSQPAHQHHPEGAPARP